MFLNVRAPPFNDIRVRRALNLALDRRQIVNSYGGPLAAQPTCQILPPGIPGYRPYCPYTRDPAADGRWRAPDLALARRLVAASGTAGMSVTVWNTPGPRGAIGETNDAVTALNELGYRASLRLLPDSTYFTYTNDSRNHAQVIDGGWSADYPSADDFIGKLTCSYFVPRDGLNTTDASEYCDPAFDTQVAHAASLQATDPSPPTPSGRGSTASSRTSRFGSPPSSPTRWTSYPAASATTSTTPSGECCSTNSGFANGMRRRRRIHAREGVDAIVTCFDECNAS